MGLETINVLATVYNDSTTVTASGTDFLSSDINVHTKFGDMSKLRIQVTLGTTAVLQLMTDDDTDDINHVLNAGVALEADKTYNFEFDAAKSNGSNAIGYNLQHTGAGALTVKWLTVKEVIGGES